jgi:hypothetical protein
LIAVARRAKYPPLIGVKAHSGAEVAVDRVRLGGHSRGPCHKDGYGPNKETEANRFGKHDPSFARL